jgi:D-alanyl-D-alanine carboxypeptidase
MTGDDMTPVPTKFGRTTRLRNRTFRFSLLAPLAIVALASGCGSNDDQGTPLPEDTLQRDLDDVVAGGAPGAILYVRNGEQHATLTAGVSDLSTGAAMRADDHIKIASLTKTYVATATLQLVEQGKLSLDDPVERWVPGLLPAGDRVIVRQLLQHTSGLADYETDPEYLAPYLAGDFGYHWQPTELVAMSNGLPPVFPPGDTEFASYSNTNYIVAGLVLEAVTGEPIDVVLRKQILDPEHLRDTSFPTEPGLPDPYAHGYMVLDGPPIDVTELSPSLAHTAGAMISTAEDAARFSHLLLSGEVLSDRSLVEMKQTILTNPDRVDITGQRYGLGLEAFPTRCGVAWGHNGVVPGYFTFVYSSEDGQHQALLTVNHDAQSLPAAAAERYTNLLVDAFCSTAPVDDGTGEDRP